MSELSAWRHLKQSPENIQIEAALVAALHKSAPGDRWGIKNLTETAIAVQLLRKNLPYSEEQLALLVVQIAKHSELEYGLPVKSILGSVERLCGGAPPHGQLKAALHALLARVKFIEHRRGSTSFTSQVRARVAGILDPTKSADAPEFPTGPWIETAISQLEGLPAADQAAWRALMRVAATSGEKSKPSKKWLVDIKPAIETIGRDNVARRLVEWLASCQPDPSQPDASFDILKGLIWASVHLDANNVALPIGRFAEVCFRKVPDMGPRSVKLGNACFLTLASMSPPEPGVAELVRLKTKIKYPSARELITKKLMQAAETAGKSLADLEDEALPDFGLTLEGRTKVNLGDARAEMFLAGDGAVLSWFGADGKTRKTVPASVRKDHKAEFAALRQRVKDINAARASLTVRLEASWLEDRCWPLQTWMRLFLRHPLRRPMAEVLIWQIESNGETCSVMPRDGRLVSVAGEIVDVRDASVVRLWHPLNSTPDEVLVWRRAIVDRGETQPIKQAHREIYVLTDAERATEIYSNRFAAHILRQYQFRALCQARGWRYEFQGSWDSWNVPTRQLPQRDLAIEYHVDPVDSDEMSEAGIPLHLSTDQVRFVRGDGNRLALHEVPPIVFSELMRDVDMFVAVASVANDPEWIDGGPEGRYGGYWRDVAFGDLSETAKTRRDLLSGLAPKLAIADRLTIGEKYMDVRGNLFSYKIHLGSSNIQIMPDNRYLCIVRGARSKDK
ncbi:MAG: DUF4132 domain-containing protein, partial [Hyphomicrobiaceae bacterium]